MAEALLKERLVQKGITNVEVSSCGLRATTGRPAHPGLGQVIGNSYGLLKDFHSRQISPTIVRKADLLLTMEERETQEILADFPETEGNVTSVRRFAGDEGDIRDYLDSIDGDVIEWMRECHSQLESIMDVVLARILRQVQTKAKNNLYRKAS